jgi:hypothetical protein
VAAQSTTGLALAAVLGWIGGVASTAVRSWLGGRFQGYEQERKGHRDELAEKVLRPLRAGLEKHFKPLVTLQQPLLSIEHAATEFDRSALVTEEPAKYGPYLVARFPSESVFGPIESTLLHDARKKEGESARRLRTRASELQMRYQEFEAELGYAIADRRLHGRCGLIPLWSL